MKAKSLKPVQLAELAPSNTMVEHDGIAALYNVEIDRRWFVMELAPKCFSKSTSNPSNIVILANHDPWSPIGKAVKFTDDADALNMDFLINTEVQAGKEVDSNIRNGVLSGLSVGFDVVKVETEKRGGEGAAGYEVDRILEAHLREVSTVAFPAIDGARIENSESASNAVTTFAIINGDAPSERLSAGDRVTLATFPARPPARVRLNSPAETESLDDVDSELEDESTASKSDVTPEPAEPQEDAVEPQEDAEIAPAELTEDERYPGAREALERILGKN